MTISAIDFGSLYCSHMAAAGGREKPASAWDARAAKIQTRSGVSSYATDFVSKMDLSGCNSLLDMGCGTGTIGLALAAQMEEVVGVDYSAGMLQAFQNNARAQGYSHTRTIQRAWEDSWDDMPQCDLVVASRSTAVMDMADALQKLDSHARQRVYLTNLVGGSFIDQGLMEAIGRNQYSRPDYIYILNILYQMGRHPRLDYIAAQGRLAGASSFDEFRTKAELSLGELTSLEQEKMSDWYFADPERASRGGEGFKWAFVSWDTSR